MCVIIRFDDEKFLKLYHDPAECEFLTKRSKLILKAYEIYYRIKEKEKKCQNKNP